MALMALMTILRLDSCLLGYMRLSGEENVVGFRFTLHVGVRVILVCIQAELMIMLLQRGPGVARFSFVDVDDVSCKGRVHVE